MLVLEDLSEASWPPPWTTSYIQAVLTTLAEVRSTPPPNHLRPLDPRLLDGWTLVADNPASFLSSGHVLELVARCGPPGAVGGGV